MAGRRRVISKSRKSGGPGSQLIGKKISRGVLPLRLIGPKKSCHHRKNPKPQAARNTLAQIPLKLLLELVVYAHVAVGIQILTHPFQ